ncbi:MAG TPA: hypothetical protein VH143_00275 [Kofleriaceae bacterium]|jgi:hypothetical protein|nr:hypothetical protein [Kofleriaceae bacterium]
MTASAMIEGNVLVNFRLDKDRPLRLKWLATDGVPGDGYKPQVTAVRLPDGARLKMDSSAILEHTAPDPSGGRGAYFMTFTGMVGYASDHPDRKHVDALSDQEIDYELEFIHEDSGRVAIDDEDFKIVERPRARAHKLS